jgi:hypothetical protein
MVLKSMDNPLALSSYNSEEDLKRLLIANEVREGPHFEFKEDYTGSVKSKLGKHVAAFANSHGGLIAIGVKATDLAASELTGINKTEFPTSAPGVYVGPRSKSLLSEHDNFTVEREVSLCGDNDIQDHVSRKKILESMIREYVGNFGTGIVGFRNQIEGFDFLDASDPQALWK